MRVAITGSTGFVGEALVRFLTGRGDDVVRVVRRPPRDGEDAVFWQPETGQLDPGVFQNVDIVVHLAGESIAAGRWTAEQKQRIRDSRVRSTTLLATALAQCTPRPRALIAASAIGFYGDRGNEELTENSTAGSGFLADVVRDWEAAAKGASAAGVRVAHARLGVVLDRDGGALARMLLPFRFGLGGKMGAGTQWWSWITRHDAVRAIAWLIDEDLTGAVNLTSPAPVTNAEFTKTLGQVLSRPTVLPLPRFAPRLLLGSELADNLLFFSQRVLPERLTASGFRFDHPNLQPALTTLLSHDRAAS